MTRCSNASEKIPCSLRHIHIFPSIFAASIRPHLLSREKRMREKRFIRPTRRPRPFCVSCAPPTGRQVDPARHEKRTRDTRVERLRTHLSGSADREKRDQSIPSWTPLVVSGAILCPSSLRGTDRSRCLAIEHNLDCRASFVRARAVR